jgi:hypothetical protein
MKELWRKVGKLKLKKSKLAKTEGNVEVAQIVCWGQKD